MRGLCGWCNWGGVLWSELTTGGIGLCTPANVAQKLTGREKEVCKIMLNDYVCVMEIRRKLACVIWFRSTITYVGNK